MCDTWQRLIVLEYQDLAFGFFPVELLAAFSLTRFDCFRGCTFSWVASNCESRVHTIKCGLALSSLSSPLFAGPVSFIPNNLLFVLRNSQSPACGCPQISNCWSQQKDGCTPAMANWIAAMLIGPKSNRRWNLRKKRRICSTEFNLDARTAWANDTRFNDFWLRLCQGKNSIRTSLKIHNKRASFPGALKK